MAANAAPQNIRHREILHTTPHPHRRGQRLLPAVAVDATVLSTPENILAERAVASRLAEAAKIIEMPLAGLVVAQNKIDTNRDQVKRMIKATLKGLMLLHQNRQEAVGARN